MQYNTIQCNTMKHNTIQGNTTQYNTMKYNTTQYNSMQYNTNTNIIVALTPQNFEATFLLFSLNNKRIR